MLRVSLSPLDGSVDSRRPLVGSAPSTSRKRSFGSLETFPDGESTKVEGSRRQEYSGFVDGEGLWHGRPESKRLRSAPSPPDAVACWQECQNGSINQCLNGSLTACQNVCQNGYQSGFQSSGFQSGAQSGAQGNEYQIDASSVNRNRSQKELLNNSDASNDANNRWLDAMQRASLSVASLVSAASAESIHSVNRHVTSTPSNAVACYLPTPHEHSTHLDVVAKADPADEMQCPQLFVTPQLVALLHKELQEFRGCPDYMVSVQRNMKPAIRATLIAFIFTMARTLDFRPDSITLALTLLNRYLSETRVAQKKHLNLLVLTCLYLAGKFNEELNEPTAKEVCELLPPEHRAGREWNWSWKDIKKCERKVLAALNFKVATVVPEIVLDEFLQCVPSPTFYNQATGLLDPSKLEAIHTKVQSSIHTFFWQTKSIKYPPSVMTAASLIRCIRNGKLDNIQEWSVWALLVPDLSRRDMVLECLNVLQIND